MDYLTYGNGHKKISVRSLRIKQIYRNSKIEDWYCYLIGSSEASPPAGLESGMTLLLIALSFV